MQKHAVLDRVITALDCKWNVYNKESVLLNLNDELFHAEWFLIFQINNGTDYLYIYIWYRQDPIPWRRKSWDRVIIAFINISVF